jgi:hypothetical protein
MRDEVLGGEVALGMNYILSLLHFLKSTAAVNLFAT